ncbi:MAG: carbohydrate ABC transporter permease, partial [Geminicoccales bacterium]
MAAPGRAAFPYLYLLPAFLFFVPFVLVPFAHTVGLSFFDWDGLTRAAFIGSENYREAFASPLVRSAFGHALVLVFFFGVLPVLLALPLAVGSARTSIPGSHALRTLIFLPQVISTVVVGVSWGWILAFDGPLNAGLRALGLDWAALDWLGSFTWALPSLGVVGTWTLVGLCVALFFAGLQQIPASLYDAAAVDGAGRWREFRAVT